MLTYCHVYIHAFPCRVIYNFVALFLLAAGGPGAVVSSAETNGTLVRACACAQLQQVDGAFLRRCKQVGNCSQGWGFCCVVADTNAMIVWLSCSRWTIFPLDTSHVDGVRCLMRCPDDLSLHRCHLISQQIQGTLQFVIFKPILAGTVMLLYGFGLLEVGNWSPING